MFQETANNLRIKKHHAFSEQIKGQGSSLLCVVFCTVTSLNPISLKAGIKSFIQIFVVFSVEQSMLVAISKSQSGDFQQFTDFTKKSCSIYWALTLILQLFQTIIPSSHKISNMLDIFSQFQNTFHFFICPVSPSNKKHVYDVYDDDIL